MVSHTSEKAPSRLGCGGFYLFIKLFTSMVSHCFDALPLNQDWLPPSCSYQPCAQCDIMLMWREVQDLNLCAVSGNLGLASRPITNSGNLPGGR